MEFKNPHSSSIFYFLNFNHVDFSKTVTKNLSDESVRLWSSILLKELNSFDIYIYSQ